MMTKPFDVSAVGYVKRVVIGNTDPEKTVNEEDIEKQRQLLNRCLSDSHARTDHRTGEEFLFAEYR